MIRLIRLAGEEMDQAGLLIITLLVARVDGKLGGQSQVHYRQF